MKKNRGKGVDTHPVKIIVEVDIAGTEITSEESGVSGEDGRDGDETSTRYH